MKEENKQVVTDKQKFEFWSNSLWKAFFRKFWTLMIPAPGT